MGKLALAAKITHVPSMYLSEFPGPNFGCREAAIKGHREIDRRCRALGVDHAAYRAGGALLRAVRMPALAPLAVPQ